MTGPRGPHLDLAGLQPEARSIAGQVATVFMQHLGSDLLSLIVHGSGVKGGIVRGSSDLDFAAIVRQSCLTPGGELPLERAIQLHRDLARIDPAPFRYLQAYVDGQPPRHGIGYIPGTYHVLAGSPDVPVATAEALVGSAHAALRALDPDRHRDRISNALLDHGESRLFRQVRFACTDVWPVMYQVACLCADDPVASWQRTKPEVVAALGTQPTVGPATREWWIAVGAHYAQAETVEGALVALSAGVEFLDVAARWYGDTWP